MALLTVRNLDVFYGRLHAVQKLSFDVEEGHIVTLLGANGAGKTSVIRAVCGLIQARRRSVQFDGCEVGQTRPGRRVGMGMATVSEGRNLFRSLTVTENLRMGGYLRRDRAGLNRDLGWIFALFPVLAAKRGAIAATLSGGEGQMLAIGRALMSRPRLLLLDEPSHGLAPQLVQEVFRLIPEMKHERNLTVLLVEQNANRALSVADYGYVLESGALALQGPSADLSRDPQVRALYLGT